MSIRSLATRIRALAAKVPAPPAPALVAIVPIGDGLPPPRWARYMNREEVGHEVERLMRGEPSPHVLTPEQQAEISARFEASGGVARVEQMQREGRI
jgi:hypothetical protein